MIVVASVHHTGTNFVWQHLLKGMKQVGMGSDGAPKNSFARIHCDLSQHIFLERWLKKCPCIVPLRHPLTVAASWKARGKNLSNLAGQWQILKTEVDPYLPMYLPIDSPEREQWLEPIRGFIDPKLQTDWPVVMSCNKSAELTDDERASVFEVMADGFFDRFGYEV